MNTSIANAMKGGFLGAMILLGAGSAQAQSQPSNATVRVRSRVTAGAPGSGKYQERVGIVQNAEVMPISNATPGGSRSTRVSNDTDVSLNRVDSSKSPTGVAMPQAQPEGTSVHSSTRIHYKPKRLAVPAGGVANSPLSGLSANTTNNVVVDTSALPLPVSLPVPVVAIQSTVGTDGIQLSDTVGGKSILPPINLPGLSSLPGISGASDLLAPVTGAVASVTGALGGAAGSGSPLAPVTGVVSGLTGALGGAAGSGSPLAPVTGVVSGLTGALGSATGGSSPLAPVTGVVSGIGGTKGSATGAGSPLAPVTGLVSGLTGALGGAAGNSGAGTPLAGVLGKL